MFKGKFLSRIRLRGTLIVGVADVVTAYIPRLQPCQDAAGIEMLSTTFREFRAVLQSLGNIESEIADGLRGLLSDRDWRGVMLWVTAAGTVPSVGLVRPLCELLGVRDGYLQHEWIAEILGDIGSQEAIEALRDACSYDLESDGRSLAKCCLESLMAIKSPEAIEAVRSQTVSPWPEVREYASELLSLLD